MASAYGLKSHEQTNAHVEVLTLRKGIDDVFKSFDFDGSGTVDKEEFLQCLISLDLPPPIVEEFTDKLDLKENDVLAYSEFVAYFMECLASSNRAIEQEQLVVENKIENKVEENSLLVKETIAQGDTNISKFAEEHPKNEDASNSNNKNPKSDNAESPRKDKGYYFTKFATERDIFNS